MTSKQLKETAKLIEPTIRIGKAGLTKSQLDEIKKQLKKKKLIKIKFLRSFLEENNKKKAAEQIAEETKAQIISTIGFTAVLHKK